MSEILSGCAVRAAIQQERCEVVGGAPKFAVLSPCGKYRYRLGRMWGRVIDPTVLFVMLNPSTADGTQDDPTIRRCVGFAKTWGFGHLLVGNMFAYRSTDPKALRALTVDEATGPENDAHLEHMASIAHKIVCAWGAPGGTRFPAPLRKHADKLFCLGMTKLGFPRHPLRLRGDTPLQRFRP